MYAAIRQGKIKPGTIEEITTRIKQGALPLLRSIKGFQTYDWVLTEDNSVSIITMFETPSAAEESQTLLLPWIREHLSPFLEGMPSTLTGRVVLHETAQS